MVFDQLSWEADQRDTEAREGEAGLFEVRALDIVNQCFESGSFSFSHVPACAEEDAHHWLASMILSECQEHRACFVGWGVLERRVNKLPSVPVA